MKTVPAWVFIRALRVAASEMLRVWGMSPSSQNVTMVINRWIREANKKKVVKSAPVMTPSEKADWYINLFTRRDRA